MSANITLKDIIEREISYSKTQRDNAVPKDFTEKYTAIAENLVKQIEEEREEEDNRIAEAKANGTDIREVLKDFPWNVEIEWYNNTVWDILTLFDKKNMFAD